MIESIMPDELNGVLKGTGYRGIGKSWFVSTIENPALTAFYDFEKKGEGIHRQIEFGLYLPVMEKTGSDISQAWQIFKASVDSIKPGKFTHVVLDNTAWLELAMKLEASKNANEYARRFGMVAENIRANRFGSQSGVVNYLISEQVCNPLWGKGVRLISTTTHIKPRWAGGQQVANSYSIKGADRWDELSILTLILMKGDHPPVPSAIVMKEQLGSISFGDGEFTTRRRLPYRLPLATPKEVARYLREPADLEHPGPGEVPSEDEVHPFQEKLDREQISILLADIRRDEAEQKVIAQQTIAQQARVLTIGETELSIPERLRRGLAV